MVHFQSCSWGHYYVSSCCITQLQSARTVEQLRGLLSSEDYDFRYALGIAQPINTIRIDDVEKIVSVIAKHYAILNVKAELDQILCGMSTTFKFLELVRENPKSLRPLFIYSDPPPLTADILYDMLPAQFSPEGDNKRELEEEAIMQWNDVTQYIEGNVYCRLNTCTYGSSLVVGHS